MTNCKINAYHDIWNRLHHPQNDKPRTHHHNTVDLHSFEHLEHLNKQNLQWRNRWQSGRVLRECEREMFMMLILILQQSQLWTYFICIMIMLNSSW